jgi:hypothetical protein
MMFKNILTRVDKGVVLVEITNETIITNKTTLSKKDIESRISGLNDEIKEWQNLLDIANAVKIV